MKRVNPKIRGCLVAMGIGLMVFGGYVVFNRSMGTENFLNTGLDLKNIAILLAVGGYLTVTVFATRFRALPIIGMATVCLALAIGSFGGGSMGSWGWVVNFVTILVLAPLAGLLCVIAGLASLGKMIHEHEETKTPIFLSATAAATCFVVLLLGINLGPVLNPAAAKLSSEDKYERIAAAKSLADIGDRRAVDPLIGMLTDPSPEIRAASAELLGEFILAGMNSDTRSIRPLITALRDASPKVRAAAALSLGRITEHLTSEAANWPVAPLKEALKDEDPAVRAAAQKALNP